MVFYFKKTNKYFIVLNIMKCPKRSKCLYPSGSLLVFGVGELETYFAAVLVISSVSKSLTLQQRWKADMSLCDPKDYTDVLIHEFLRTCRRLVAWLSRHRRLMTYV